MTTRDPGPSEAELQRQREVIRRSLLRANTAVAIVLLAVLGLAVVAILYSQREARQRRAAQHQQHRAEQAEREGREQVYRSALAQSRAERLTGRMGARAESLAAISNAARIHASVDLRSEALAALSMLDVDQIGPLHTVPGNSRLRDFSPDLKTLIAIDRGGQAVVYRTEDDTERFRFDVNQSRMMQGRLVRAGRFSPDGRWYVLIAREALAVWDLKNRRPIFDHAPGATGTVSHVSFTPDSRFIVFSTSWRGDEVVFFDLATAREQPQRAPIGKNPYALSFTAPEVAVATTNEIQFWNYQTGERLRTLVTPQRLGLIFWSTDGRLLTGSAANGDVLLWKLDRNEFQVLTGHTEPANMLGVTDRGDIALSSSGDGTTRLWEVASGRALLTLPGQTLTFAEDDERIGFEVDNSRVGIWRMHRPTGFRALAAPDTRLADVLSADLSTDGRWLAALVPGGVQVWDLEVNNAGKFVPAPSTTGLAWHPDGPSLFLCRSGAVQRCALERTGSGTNRSFNLGAPATVASPEGSYAHQVAASADGSTLALELADRRVLTLGLQSPRSACVLEGQSTTRNYLGWATPTGSGRMALSPDGNWICAGYGFTNHAVVSDTRTGRAAAGLDTRGGGTAFSPDGRWLVTTGKNQYDFWRVGSWERERSLARETLLGRRGLMAVAPKASLLAVTRNAGTVELLDAASFEPLAWLSPPRPQSLTCLRFSHDGRRLVAGTANSLMLVWDLPVFRQQLARLGLDWAQPAGQQPLAAVAPGVPNAAASPTAAILAGLAGVGVAAYFALSALRRHHTLVQDFVKAEAEALRRHRQLEVAKVELMHSQKMKALGTLAAGIAHDFNNLLSVIRMSNKLVGRAAKDNAGIAEEVANIEEAVLQGKQVVSSMLGYSREASDDDGTCDLDEVVEETVSLLSREFLSGIELTLALDRHSPTVRAGRGRIAQVLLNLVVNASEAMNGQGKLKIAVQPAGPDTTGAFVLRPRGPAPWVELVVSDSGPGITPEVLPRIFEPFFTTKMTGAKEGTGLGLSMVYAIAEQDGLGLAVASQTGQGATFRLIAPACAPDAQFPNPDAGDKRKA